MTDRCCKNCDAWEDLKLPGQDAGECRATLPAITCYASANVEQYRPMFLNVGSWPITSAAKWCRFFVPREEPSIEA